MFEALANLRTGDGFTDLHTCLKQAKVNDILVVKLQDKTTQFKKTVLANVGLWIDDVSKEEITKAYQRGLINKRFL